MKIVLIDGNKVTDISLLHKEFSKTLDFPKYYGNNLDALYDMLSETTEEIGIIAVNTDLIEENLGDKWKAFKRLIKDVKSERKNIHFTSKPFGK